MPQHGLRARASERDKNIPRHRNEQRERPPTTTAKTALKPGWLVEPERAYQGRRIGRRGFDSRGPAMPRTRANRQRSCAHLWPRVSPRKGFLRVSAAPRTQYPDARTCPSERGKNVVKTAPSCHRKITNEGAHSWSAKRHSPSRRLSERGVVTLLWRTPSFWGLPPR